MAAVEGRDATLLTQAALARQEKGLVAGQPRGPWKLRESSEPVFPDCRIQQNNELMEKLKKSLRDRPNETAWLEASARDSKVANRPTDTARKAL